MTTLIIAEAGVNHNGDMSLARQLVEASARAGADMVKFQTFDADRLVTPDAGMSEYQCRNTASDQSQRDMLKHLQLSADDHRMLIAHCEECGIEFLSTGFDIESLDLLMDLGAKLIKVPSGEITNLPYLRHVGRCGKRVLLSTGMCDMADIRAALDVLEQAGTPRDNVTVLHCTTAYPTAMRDANLRAMLTVSDELGMAVGFSDHTIGIEAAIAAVALGASVIEKHLTLDKDLPGPDHKASIEPDELAAMVRAIRNVEMALGDGTKRATQAELRNLPFARKSLVASRDIRAGEIFDDSNIAAMRPGTGLSPMRWDDVMGCAAPRDFRRHEQIEL